MNKPMFADMNAGTKALMLFSFWFLSALLLGLLAGRLDMLFFGIDPNFTTAKEIGVDQHDMYRNAMWLATLLSNPVAALLALFTFLQLAEPRGSAFISYKKYQRKDYVLILILLGLATAAASLYVQWFNEEVLQLFGSARDGIDKISETVHKNQEIILSGDWTVFAINVVLIGIIVPIGEEFIFRAGIQQYLINVSRKVGVGVIFAALVFAIIHMEFDGFLVRFGMGVLLGYIYVWSRNIWASVLVHSLYNIGLLSLERFEKSGQLTEQMGKIIPAIGMLIAGILIYYLWKLRSSIPPEQLSK